MANDQKKKQVATALSLPRCLVCSQPANKRCSGCHEADYCSSDHQRQHWKQHKKSCSPFQIITKADEQGGVHQYAVASRKLTPMSAILQEPPLTYAPLDIEDDAESIPVLCLACCVHMVSNPAQRCTKCSWPICSKGCEKVKQHSEFECAFFSEKRLRFPPKKSGAVYLSILILRLLLLKQRNPVQWKKFMDVDSRNKVIRCLNNGRKMQREEEMIIENLTEYSGGGNGESLKEMCSSREDLRDILNQVNALSFIITRQEEHRRDKTYYRGIYLKANSMSHGCIPNATWAVSYSPNFELCVRTSVPVEKDARIQLLFDDQWTSLGTYQRQLCKSDIDEGPCDCKRCTDKTECDTYVSALKCPTCPAGYLLPDSPTDLNAEALWRCTDSDCTRSEEQEKIMSILHHCAIDMEKILAIIQPHYHHPDKEPSGSSILDKLNQLEELHDRLCETRLHPQHFLVRALQNKSITLASYCLQELSFPQLDRCILHCERLLHVSTILAPGDSPPSAIIRKHLCQFMLRKKLKAAKEGKTLTVFGCKKSLLDYLNKLDKLQREVLAYYESDPDSKPPNGMISSIVKQLKQDNTTVTKDIKLTISSIMK